MGEWLLNEHTHVYSSHESAVVELKLISPKQRRIRNEDTLYITAAMEFQILASLNLPNRATKNSRIKWLVGPAPLLLAADDRSSWSLSFCTRGSDDDQNHLYHSTWRNNGLVSWTIGCPQLFSHWTGLSRLWTTLKLCTTTTVTNISWYFIVPSKFYGW